MSRYLPYRGHIFNRYKVLNIVARNSYFYIWHPYVVEMRYQKHWTETDYINLGEKVSYSIPISVHHSAVEYKFKHRTIEDIKRDIVMFRERCPNAEVMDNIY